MMATFWWSFVVGAIVAVIVVAVIVGYVILTNPEDGGY